MDIHGSVPVDFGQSSVIEFRSFGSRARHSRPASSAINDSIDPMHCYKHYMRVKISRFQKCIKNFRIKLRRLNKVN